MQDTEKLAAVAVTIAEPILRAITLPLSTFAMDSSDEDQTTVLSVASSGFTVAVKVAVSPIARDKAVLSRVMDDTGTATVTAHSAVLPPHFAVTVALPDLMAVTLPLSTLATDSSEDVQVTFWSVASSGFTTAVTVADSPMTRDKVDLSRVMDDTGTVTVTAHSAVLSPHLAVIVALPDLRSATLPLSTLATDSSEDDHVTVLSVASSGFTVAVSCAVSPTDNESVVLSRVIDSVFTEKFVNKRGYKITVEGLSEKFNPEYWNYAKLISGVLRYRMPIKHVIKLVSQLQLTSESINTWKVGVERALKNYLKDDELPVSCSDEQHDGGEQ